MTGSFKGFRGLRFRRQLRERGEDVNDRISSGLDENKSPNEAVSAANASQPMGLQPPAFAASQTFAAGYDHGYQTEGTLPFIPRDASASMQPSLFDDIVQGDHTPSSSLPVYYPKTGAHPPPDYSHSGAGHSAFYPAHFSSPNPVTPSRPEPAQANENTRYQSVPYHWQLDKPPVQDSGTTLAGIATGSNIYQGFNSLPHGPTLPRGSSTNYRAEYSPWTISGLWPSPSAQSDKDKVSSSLYSPLEEDEEFLSLVGPPTQVNSQEKQLGLVYGDNRPHSYTAGPRPQDETYMGYELPGPRGYSTDSTQKATSPITGSCSSSEGKDAKDASDLLKESPTQSAAIGEDVHLLHEFTKHITSTRCTRCNTRIGLRDRDVIKMTRNWASTYRGKYISILVSASCVLETDPQSFRARVVWHDL